MVVYDPYTARITLEEMNNTKKPTAEEIAFELERSQITSYEENWDPFDGPVWPLGTVQCSLQNPNCRLTPCPEHHPFSTSTYEAEKAALTSYEENFDPFDGPIWPLGTVQCSLQNPKCTLKPCREHHPEEYRKSLEEEQFEKEKNEIECYEENWDPFDGPVWPLGTVQCDLQDPDCKLSLCPEHHPQFSGPTTPDAQK